MYASRDFAERPEPLEPTAAIPGTQAKLDIMRERAEAGFSLFHPNDRRVEDNRRCSRPGLRRGNYSAADLDLIIQAILDDAGDE